jgi:hypothetical protein
LEPDTFGPAEAGHYVHRWSRTLSVRLKPDTTYIVGTYMART